mmetsp:Transcript_39058/g.91580  ORF Transcript_39058/g.91580 Transcript_39058/m.91580 type:complete len:210 (+) Transcript_39058:869-1498(+)
MAQDVPHSGDALEITLHGVNYNLLRLAIHHDAESRVFIQWTVIDIAKHWVHQAHDARRVLFQHLVQDLAESPGTDLHPPFRNGVLDGRHEDVARLHPHTRGLGDAWRSGVHDHAQIDTCPGIHQQDQHHRSNPKDGRSHCAPHREPRRLSLATVFFKRWQRGTFTDGPVPDVVGLHRSHWCEDGHVACGQIPRHQQIRDVVVHEDHCQP